jgi:hypothetical protein
MESYRKLEKKQEALFNLIAEVLTFPAVITSEIEGTLTVELAS